MERPRPVHRADVRAARAADRRIRVRRPPLVPAGESRRRRRSPRPSRRAPDPLTARFVRTGQRDSRDLGLDALLVLRRVRRIAHRHHHRRDQQRRARPVRSVRPRFLFLLRRLLSLLQSRDGYLLPAADSRRADGRYAAFRAQADRAQRSAGRQDARQPRESARLLVPDVDDGAHRHHRPDARRRAHQRVASRVHRMGIRRPRRRPNGRRARRRRDFSSMAVAGARADRVRAAVLLPVHQAASSDLRPAESFLPQHGSARTPRADQGFRDRGNLRRLASRAVHLEATARHGLVPRMRPLHDQLSHRQHRQDAESQVPRDRTTRASARQGAVPARGQEPTANPPMAPKRRRGTVPT